MRCSRDAAAHRALAWWSAAMVAAVVACDGGNDRVSADAGPPDDAPLGPGLIVQVSNLGNDAHDGITQPVETLKRAVAIATANPQVTDIVLASGRYAMRQGEAFPYTLPPNVIGLAGPPGGAAVLVGTGSETGLILTGGQIQDIELDNFAVAIDGTGALRIKNLRVATSAVAIHGGDGVEMRIDNLEIAGTAGSPTCAVGLKLDGVTHVTLTSFTARDVSPAIFILNHSSQIQGAIDIAQARIALSPETICATSVLSVLDSALTLSDSTIEGGFDRRPRPGGRDGPHGIDAYSAPGMMAPVTISHTTLRHLHFGMSITGAVVRIDHSELTDNLTGFQGGAGSWSLTDVQIARNLLGLVVGGDPVNGPVMLTMRNCTVSEHNSNGIELGDYADADLGTIASPGNNVLTSNFPVVLDIAGAGPTQVDAVGNTWQPSVQDADTMGRYPTVDTVTGPIGSSFGNNFAIASGWSLQR